MPPKTPPSLDNAPLILASRSPRRIELLRRIGLPFEVCPSDVDERAARGRRPDQKAVAAAQMKAQDIARDRPDRIVLGADTIVCLGDRILGKPGDAGEARAMLRALRGRWHTVVTGLCLVAPGRPPWTAAEHTRVRMADFSDADRDDYIATGEPFDKAGGYAIQGDAARLVASVDGDYYNVVGLPLDLLLTGLSLFLDVATFTVPPPPARFV